ncbi:MAG TPA: SDR family NAD(P)-dependent oxidoreductase [Actinomycetota bacterium]|nr:SDR family NAD(P)-dependent oxidoreductase [Actinomycetota bacterium]
MSRATTDARGGGGSLAANVVDAAIEALVVPSFTSIGYGLRRRLYGWRPLTELSMHDRVVAITGATSGLGEWTATALARLGARVLVLGRDAGKAARVAERIREETGNDGVVPYEVDVSDMDAVRRVAAEIRSAGPKLDVLIHNAGALLNERTTSVDGYEMTFATMVLGPFLLTRELVPMLADGADGRVITVTSGGMYTRSLHVDDLQMEHEPYRGTIAYAQAKRAQVVLTRIWASRHRGTGVVFHAMHPGWADTPGLEASLPGFRKLLGPVLRSAEQGADTIVWLAAAPEPSTTSGRLWLDRRPRSFDKLPGTSVGADDAIALWQTCERLTDLRSDGGVA